MSSTVVCVVLLRILHARNRELWTDQGPAAAARQNRDFQSMLAREIPLPAQMLDFQRFVEALDPVPEANLLAQAYFEPVAELQTARTAVHIACFW